MWEDEENKSNFLLSFVLFLLYRFKLIGIYFFFLIFNFYRLQTNWFLIEKIILLLLSMAIRGLL